MIDPNATLGELQSRDAEITEELSTMDADLGTGVPNETQQAAWKQLVAEREDVRKQVIAKQERIADLGTASPTSHEAGTSFGVIREKTNEDIFDLSTVRGAFDNPAQARRELQERAKYAIERADYGERHDTTGAGEFKSVASTEQMQENVAHLIRKDHSGEIARRILSTGAPEYEDGFWKALAGRQVTNKQAMLLERALGASTTGYAMPFTLDPTVLLTSNGAINPIRQVARVVQITGQTWNGVNSAGITAGFTAEATELSDNAPTLTQPTVTVLKADAFVPYSLESEGWADIRSEIASEMADAKDVLESNKFTIGTGTTEPLGFINGATNLATTAASAVIALVDIDTLVDSLPPRFEPKAIFMAHRKFYSKVRQLGRTAGVTDEWPNLTPGYPPSLVGYPRYLDSDVASTITTVGSLVAGFGDFADGYLIVDRVGMQVESIQHLVGTSHRPTGQRGIIAYWFTNGTVRSTAPLRVLKINT